VRTISGLPASGENKSHLCRLGYWSVPASRGINLSVVRGLRGPGAAHCTARLRFSPLPSTRCRTRSRQGESSWEPGRILKTCTVAARQNCHSERVPLRAVHLSRHKWPKGFVKAFWALLSLERPEPSLSPLSLLVGSMTEIFGARAGRHRSGSRRWDTADGMYQEQL